MQRSVQQPAWGELGKMNDGPADTQIITSGLSDRRISSKFGERACNHKAEHLWY